MEKNLDNPFAFGVFVSGEQFYDRAEIRSDLLRYIRNRQNVLLYGPRRYGKSSLAANVAEELRREGRVCIWFDLMKVNSLEHFVAEYAKAAYAVASRTERNLQKVLGFFRALRPKVSVGTDGETSFGIELGTDGVGPDTVEEVLSLPERLAGDGRIVVFFDEFQEIGRLSSELALERIFRSVIQRQTKVDYVFLGSKTHTLRRMFTDAARPFYESAAVLCMSKPPEDESVAFLVSRFGSFGVTCPEPVARAIMTAANNIPYYLQALGAEVFDRVKVLGGSSVRQEDVAAAGEKLRRQKRDVFDARLETLTAGQRMLVSALAHETTGEFSEEYRKRHGLGVYTTVTSATKTLLDRGVLECEAGVYRVADPFFAAYLNEATFGC